MWCAHFADVCEKCGNKRNMRQSHIRIKLTCPDSSLDSLLIELILWTPCQLHDSMIHRLLYSTEPPEPRPNSPVSLQRPTGHHVRAPRLFHGTRPVSASDQVIFRTSKTTEWLRDSEQRDKLHTRPAVHTERSERVTIAEAFFQRHRHRRHIYSPFSR